MNKHKTGFTVIETVLVLAIAGLIVLGAFIALPALWISQRDSARETNIAEFAKALKTYQTNASRGALPSMSSYGQYLTVQCAHSSDGCGFSPTPWEQFIKEYISKDFADPSGNASYGYGIYVLKCVDSGGAELSIGQPCKTYNDNQPVNFYGLVNSKDNPVFDNPTTKDLNYALFVAVGATCDGNTAVKVNNARSFAIVQVLERGGKYCYSS